MDSDKIATEIIDLLEKELSNKPSEEAASKLRNKLLQEEVGKLFAQVKDLPADQRASIGKLANELKQKIETRINDYLREIKQSFNPFEKIDLTAPAIRPELGHTHPETQILDLVEESFGELGFSVVDGPAIETDYYCFQQLNMPEDHPARDMQDSFYLNKELTILPRTHTSSMQIRHMEQNKPPIKILVPGRVFRNEKIDARHFIEFYQFEGLVVDDHTTVADLKGTIQLAMQKVMADPNLKVRFRHAYFPYTEPSFEIDFSCRECAGTGKKKDLRCKVCSGKGWMEIGGLGMVHPQVLKNVNIDPDKYQGFAFGWGPARLAMVKYNIPNLTYGWKGDLRFLKQF
jgi:phenylalanyl-tRNA synthetase alpha chain